MVKLSHASVQWCDLKPELAGPAEIELRGLRYPEDELHVHTMDSSASLILPPGAYSLLAVRTCWDGSLLRARRHDFPHQQVHEVQGAMRPKVLYGAISHFSAGSTAALVVDACSASVRWYELEPNVALERGFVLQAAGGPNSCVIAKESEAGFIRLALQPGLY